MLRYIILVFLLNTRFTSLGKSIPDNIGLELDALSTVCVNNFLKDQIEKKVSTCSVKLQPYNEDYLRCLLFYDMSKQLCVAASTDKLDLHEEQIQELSKPMTVVNVCSSAAKWNVTNIPQYPEYKFKIDKITGVMFSCAVLCSEDPMSLHAKFACQYYNWGFNILNKTLQQPPDEAPKNEVTLPSENVINDVNILKTAPGISGSENNDVSSIQGVGQEHSPFSKPSDAQPQIKQEPSTVVDSTASSNKVEANIVPTVKGQQPTDIQKQKSVPEIPSHNSAVEKPIFEEEKPPQQSELEKVSDLNLNNGKDLGEDSKIKSIDGDDYSNAEIEGDEGKDGLADTQGGDDGDGEPMPDVDMKMTNQEKIIKKIDTSIAALQGGVLSEREYVSNTFPEAFSPSDDHFFPIFLSVIVIIIVLYVLYHNKNKVTKVVLGLLIEGRQSGRRRNSRGHAYRRLDTLEQAMSANSAAPPSKIIY